MYDRSESISQLAAALAAAQGEIQAATESGKNPHLRSRYATLGDVWAACRLPLSKNGLAVLQPPSTDVENGVVTVTTVLLHASGEFIECQASLPVGDTRGISSAQALGVVITYLRRYLLSSLVGVYAGDDTDGEMGEKATTPAPPQRRSTLTPAGNPIPTPAEEAPADSGNGQPAKQTVAERIRPTKAMMNRLHSLGVQKFGSGWDDARHELVKKLTDGRTHSSADLSYSEVVRLAEKVKEFPDFEEDKPLFEDDEDDDRDLHEDDSHPGHPSNFGDR